MATFIDNLGAVSVPLNSGRLLLRQSVNGTDVDSKITFANLVANLVNSSSIGSSSGQIPQLVTGTYGVALPTLSGENLTNLNFSTINVGTGTVTGTTKLSDSLVSTSGTTGGFAATPNAVRLLKADYTNLLTTKANIDTTNTFSSLQTFSSGVRIVGDMKPDTISITDITNTATSEVLRNNSGTLQWKGINIVLTTALGTASAKNLTTAGATIWDTGNLDVSKLVRSDVAETITNSWTFDTPNNYSVVQNLNAGIYLKRPSSSTQQFLNTNDTGRLENNGVRLIEDTDLTNSNSSTETNKATTPSGVEARITRRISLDVEGTYLKLVSGTSQTIDSDIVNKGSLAVGQHSSVGTNNNLDVYGSLTTNSLNIGVTDVERGTLFLDRNDSTNVGGYVVVDGIGAYLGLGDSTGGLRVIETMAATSTTSGTNYTIKVSGAEVLTTHSLSNNNSVGTETNIGSSRIGVEAMMTRFFDAKGFGTAAFADLTTSSTDVSGVQRAEDLNRFIWSCDGANQVIADGVFRNATNNALFTLQTDFAPTSKASTITITGTFKIVEAGTFTVIATGLNEGTNSFFLSSSRTPKQTVIFLNAMTGLILNREYWLVSESASSKIEVG